jgi:hypothetical protein
MVGGRWDPDAWSGHATMRSAKAAPTVDHIYTSTKMHPDLDPKGIKLRESRDSDANPASTAVIVALDVTGSMERVLDAIARKGLGTLVQEIHDRKPVTDPHVMIMGVGDFECDISPLQVTQFEAEVKPMTDQLEKIWLERHGGGNSHESYTAPWFFAAMHTSIDCFEKRGKKGYLFTVGDEQPNMTLYADNLRKHLADAPEADLTIQQLLEMVSRTYHVFHVMVEEGSHYRNFGDRVRKEWTDILGQRAIPLQDHKMLAEVIVSTIEVTEGRDAAAVTASWSGDTSLVVARAISGLPSAVGTDAVVRVA